jgi:hypothetical protein
MVKRTTVCFPYRLYRFIHYFLWKGGMAGTEKITMALGDDAVVYHPCH